MKFALYVLVSISPLMAGAIPAAAHVAKIAIPGVKGALELDVGPGDFQTQVRSDGKEVQLRALQRQDGVEITAFLQRVDFPASPEQCKAEWWPGTKNSVPVQREGLRESGKDGVATVEYLIPEFRGVKVRQKNVHAYLGANDLCAEVHVSKAAFQSEDAALFDQVLKTVRLIPDETPANVAAEPDTSQENGAESYFRKGSELYLQQNYPAAAEMYQKALDLEKEKHTLTQNYFRVLVDNLGMSYGMTGKLDQARETFEYGLTQDPEYPMFHYNMACYHGEKQELQESISELRLAYKYKGNSIPGESIPDPMQDDSFRYFTRNQTFVDAVRNMQK
jgi:tetratricopeptide (TPR) repeat protein